MRDDVVIQDVSEMCVPAATRANMSMNGDYEHNLYSKKYRKLFQNNNK